MAPVLPSRLLGHDKSKFFVFDPRPGKVNHFDIVSYTGGPQARPYNCDINGVGWNVTISRERLEDVKRLMVSSSLQYLWVHGVCINEADAKEKSAEVSRMYEYYKSARMCHILLDMPQVLSSQDIADDLRFLDDVLSNMSCAEIASETRSLTRNTVNRLSVWRDRRAWTFGVDLSAARLSAIDMGVLNCYSTCINYVRSVFDNTYFSRMWTFQEMVLAGDITIWSINAKKISRIGKLHEWMDLVLESRDMAHRLQDWIEDSRVLKSGGIHAILQAIEDDNRSLGSLQTQVMGISAARTDIVNGGPHWWRKNHRGVSNVFSAVALKPRTCTQNADMFRGLLGIFSGLFTAEEVEREMSGDDMGKMSLAFFKQLSTKTGHAWTRLATGSRERGEWDWIPRMENHTGVMTTDFFAGVFSLGLVKAGGQAKAVATMGIAGAPQKYMNIRLKKNTSGFHFVFRGCNCGAQVKTGVLSSEPIPTHGQPVDVDRDDTGRVVVQCATILGSLMDPGRDVVEFRRRLLRRLQPKWDVSDPNARLPRWIDRCVSGTSWERADSKYLRTHNMSVNYRMASVTGCGSRLANEITEGISCEVRVKCGCTITAPFSFIFEGLSAMGGGFLGGTTATLDEDGRILLRDGLGLLEVGKVGSSFDLVAFGGDVKSYESHSSHCRRTRMNKPLAAVPQWPRGRVLVREELAHRLKDRKADCGYVETGGSGNLLIWRSRPMEPYTIMGVCIDEEIECKRRGCTVMIR